MKVVIECWIDHHHPLSEKEITNLGQLYVLIHYGRIWFREDKDHDQKIKITIEVEE